MRELPSSRHRFVVVLGTSVVLAAVLVAASQVSARGADETKVKTTAAAAQRGLAAPGSSLFAGIPQRGAVLGSPKAPVTLVEYADLQCPYCAQWARDTLPDVVNEYVRTGKLRIVFNGLAFIGPDSVTALRTVIAAGRQDHLWDLLHSMYTTQGAENSGWVSDQLVRDLAGRIHGLDGSKLIDARWQRAVESEMQRAADAARAAGVSGTPAFQIGRTGGRLRSVMLGSLQPDGIVPAIEATLAR